MAEDSDEYKVYLHIRRSTRALVERGHTMDEHGDRDGAFADSEEPIQPNC